MNSSGPRSSLYFTRIAIAEPLLINNLATHAECRHCVAELLR